MNTFSQAGVLVETWINGNNTAWLREWKTIEGKRVWLDMGGKVNMSSNPSVITFPKSFHLANLGTFWDMVNDSGATQGTWRQIRTESLTGATVNTAGYTAEQYFNWSASGI